MSLPVLPKRLVYDAALVGQMVTFLRKGKAVLYSPSSRDAQTWPHAWPRRRRPLAISGTPPGTMFNPRSKSRKFWVGPEILGYYKVDECGSGTPLVEHFSLDLNI